MMIFDEIDDIYQNDVSILKGGAMDIRLNNEKRIHSVDEFVTRKVNIHIFGIHPQ